MSITKSVSLFSKISEHLFISYRMIASPLMKGPILHSDATHVRMATASPSFVSLLSTYFFTFFQSNLTGIYWFWCYRLWRSHLGKYHHSKVKSNKIYMGEYQIILVQWPGLAYQDKIICIRQQSDEYHVFCKYYLFLRRFSHWHHKGNTATGMRRFGVLIDQVRFQEYITAAPKLICYLFDRATQRPSKLPAVA